MKKKYFLLIIALSSFEFALSQILSSAPTLTFTNNTGVSSDNIASDGDGGSVNISDIDIQIYNISDIGGTFVAPLSWENNAFYGIAYNALTANVATGTKGMLIKSVSGAEFKLEQFVYLNWGETASTINTVKGYRNGVEVASTTFQAYSPSFTPTTITFGTTLENVDEVRFYISSGGYQGSQAYSNHSINSIKVSSPVLSTSEFELKTKLKIYPTSTSKMVNVALESLEKTTIKVYDSYGRFQFEKELKEQVNSIDIESLSSGIYFFKISSIEGTATQRVIKN